MTVQQARRLLHKHGRSGNWRFKGLMLAALPGSDVSAQDVAKAWPKAKKGDYRFLSGHSERDLETEMARTVVGEQGTDRHRLLSDYVKDADTPKHLGSASVEETEDGQIQARLDDAIPRMLFAGSSPEEVDTLFREQLLETVMEGAERRKVARDAANVINVETRSGDVPVASDETYAPAVAQGAEIRDKREQYANISWSTTKYAQGARVTDEMVDQGMVDVIERQIQFVGAAVENAVNRDWLTTLVDDADGNHDTAGSDQGYQALNEAYGVVDEQDFIPDTYVTHPQFRTALAGDSNLAYANRAGTADVLEDREEASLFENIAGLDTHAPASSNTYDSDNGSETWGYGSDEKGAVVYDQDHIHLLLYSADGDGMTVKDYEDPIRDLQGVNARLECDTQYSQTRAAATIQG